MAVNLPAWAERIRRERVLRGWSQADAVRALLTHGGDSLPGREHVLRRWKSWEAGEHKPDDRYQGLIAATFGTARHAMFPVGRRDASGELVAATGMDTLEVIARVRRSDLDGTTLDALRLTVDRLCTEYAYVPAEQLVVDGREWLGRVADLRDGRLTLAQHREVLSLAGWLALLVGCLEFDAGHEPAAEATRRAALSHGQESGDREIEGWAQEMRAWFALTSGDYRGVVAAARAGTEAAKDHSVSVQLAAQKAKAWARIGDRRQVEVALDRGRQILDALPYPDNVAHHFVVDPSKFDFYAMDCYRTLGDDAMAENLAEEVLRTTGDRSPMRRAEARFTLGVVAARTGNLEGAVDSGRAAIANARTSLPHFVMLGQELARHLQRRYPGEKDTHAFLEQLRALSRAPKAS
ncbi:XRE family transcriptional regulator [Actinopolymorpha sp. B17G11]|uniref:XRE family transcriptional regulator n=1 Tax=Actinopolymorpha sp. B17G11 TaxID=3160861 RepID=UPI0032E46244